MADGNYQAPLLNTQNDPQYNYYGQQQTPAGPNPNAAANPQYAYYGAQQQQQPQAVPQQQVLVVAQAPGQQAYANPSAPPAQMAVMAAETPAGPYSFESVANPKPSAPPEASAFSNNYGSFSESNYNMEGYLYRHPSENTNLKIHQPEGYNHQEVTNALHEDASSQQLVSVTGRGPGCWKGCMQSPHLKSWFLALALWALVALKLVCLLFDSCVFPNDSPVFYVVLVVVLLLYLVETGCSSSRRYLSNTFEKDGMVNFVGRLQEENRPRIWWRVECYHYETRYRTVTKTDANGKTRTERESYRERVVTWTAYEYYRYRTCQDVSGAFSYGTRDMNNPNVMVEHLILQLRLYKTFSFANAMTAADYNYKAMLFRWFNDRDVYQDFHYGIEINGFKSAMLGELEPGNKPECMALHWYWILSLLGMSPCYRTWFSSKCHKKTFLINKQLSI